MKTSTTQTNRRAFLKRGLATAAIAPVALAAPRLLAQASLEKLRVSIIPIADVAPMFAAMKMGYFADLGLEIDTTPSAGGATGIPGLMGGSFDVVYGNIVSAVIAKSRDLPLKIIAPGTVVVMDVADDNVPLIARTASNIASGKDLEGKSVAVNTRSNVIWLYAYQWIAKTGGDPTKVQFKEVPFPQMIDALRQEQVDAALVVQPFSLAAASDDALSMIAYPYTEVQPGVEVGEWITSNPVLASKSDQIKRFVEGLRKGVEWYNENLESSDVQMLISDYSRVDPAILAKIDLRKAPVVSNPDQIVKTMDLMVSAGLITEPVDLDALLDPLALAE